MRTAHTTPAHTTTTRAASPVTGRRGAVRLALVVATALAVAAPAAAIEDFQDAPPPQPVASIDAEPVCDAGEGISYQASLTPEPEGPLLRGIQWRPVGGDTASAPEVGFLPVGEGDFELRARYQEIEQLGPNGIVAGEVHVSDWLPVTVDCSPDTEPQGGDEEEPGDEPEDDDTPGDGPSVGSGTEDEIVVGRPTFTG